MWEVVHLKIRIRQEFKDIFRENNRALDGKKPTQTNFIAVKEHVPNKADKIRLRSRTQNMFSYLDFRCYFEVNGPN